MSATITYKGETLETLNGGEYVTLHTNGKQMEDDIRVELAEVSVIDSPLPIEIETEDQMTGLLDTAEIGSVYKYMGGGGTYENEGLYIVSDGEAEETEDSYQKGYGVGFLEGKKAEYDAFWDVFQQNGSNNYKMVNGVFNGKRFTAANFFPKYDIKPIGDAQYLFYAWEATAGLEHTILDLKQRLEDCGVVLDTSQATNMTRAFSYCSFIDNIPTLDCTGLTGGSHIFASSGIARIEKVIINETTSFASWFASTRSLTEIRFDGVIGNSIAFGDCSLLSTASVKSVIDHLKDLTGLTSQTLTLHASVGAKLTEEQKEAITAKNWQLVY